MHTDRSIEQEQADQVRRTTGATLAARALEEVLPAIASGYGPNMHRKAGKAMAENMHKPGFTPGPWKFRIDDHGRGRIYGNGFWVGTTWTAADDDTAARYPAEANARLIAAAPDLLAACEEVVRHYQEMSGNPACPIPDRYWIRGALMARAALSAARGEGRWG